MSEETMAKEIANEWDERLQELYRWTGSAFLAGERVDDEKRHKADLYSWLCSMIGWFMAARDAEAAKSAAEAERDEARAAMKWVREVYPGRAPANGAAVQLTWDEFNRMREAIGLQPIKRIGSADAKASINGELRARLTAAEAEAERLKRENSRLATLLNRELEVNCEAARSTLTQEPKPEEQKP